MGRLAERFCVPNPGYDCDTHIVIHRKGKRDSYEIAAAILRSAKKGARKTHLVYQAHLNFEVTNKYLKQLKTAGLLEGPIGQRRIYKTTERGHAYLDQYQALKDRFDEQQMTEKNKEEVVIP